jgi:hypothetical protein
VRHNDLVTFYVEGDLPATAVPSLARLLDGLDGPRPLHLVFDLSRAGDVDAAALVTIERSGRTLGDVVFRSANFATRIRLANLGRSYLIEADATRPTEN